VDFTQTMIAFQLLRLPSKFAKPYLDTGSLPEIVPTLDEHARSRILHFL
jgi:hypothetical protein